MKTRLSVVFGILAIATVAIVLAQPPLPPRGFGPPGPRRHTVTKAGKLSLLPAREEPTQTSNVKISVQGEYRVIRGNGIPNHKTGQFPNRGNPNKIREQRYVYKIPARPVIAEDITPLGMQNFGIALNGVPFDPGAAEFYNGKRGSKWQYEPLSGAIDLGIDVSHAHVQPNGAYHYHGLPTEFLSTAKVDAEHHSPQIGWAADGFPIYAVYGFIDAKNAESGVQAMNSSYRLKSGERPGGVEPSGAYDGTFVADYEFVAESGDLDECNGRQCVTPDFPDGTYAYFLTEDWPVVPRNFRGTPSEDFARRGPPR